MYNTILLQNSEQAEFNSEKLLNLQIDLQAKYGFWDDVNSFEQLKSHYSKFFAADPINKLFVIIDENNYIGLIKLHKGADWGAKEQQIFNIRTTLKANFDSLNTVIGNLISQNKVNELQYCLTTYNDEFSDFAQFNNGKIQVNTNKYTLDKADIDLNLLQNWIKTGESKNPDLRIEFSYGVKEEYIDQYCSLFTETMLDMTNNSDPGFVPYVITPEMQRKQNQRNEKAKSHYCYMVFNKQNEMIAKTNVGVNGDYPYQFMIGVKREYRGKGIGRWLHGAMYSKIHREVPFKKIHIDHHPLNRSAIKLSLEAGYKFVYNEKKYIF